MKHSYLPIMIFILTLYLFVTMLGVSRQLAHIQRDLLRLLEQTSMRVSNLGITEGNT